MPESVLRTRHRCRASAVIGPSPREVRLSAAVSVPRRRRRSRRARRDALVFLAMALPNFVLIGAFTYRPLIMNIYYSTLNWTLGSATATIVGFGNYVRFFTSDAAGVVLTTTAIFAVLTVGGSMLLGLLVALALNTKVRGQTLARASVFAPYVLSGVGVGLVWLFTVSYTHLRAHETDSYLVCRL